MYVYRWIHMCPRSMQNSPDYVSKSFRLFSIERGNDKPQTRRDFEFHSWMIDLNKMLVIRHIFVVVVVVQIGIETCGNCNGCLVCNWCCCWMQRKPATCNGFQFIEPLKISYATRNEQNFVQFSYLKPPITRYVLALFGALNRRTNVRKFQVAKTRS